MQDAPRGTAMLGAFRAQNQCVAVTLVDALKAVSVVPACTLLAQCTGFLWSLGLLGVIDANC